MGKGIGLFSGPERAVFVDGGREEREQIKVIPPFWFPRTQGWEADAA